MISTPPHFTVFSQSKVQVSYGGVWCMKTYGMAWSPLYRLGMVVSVACGCFPALLRLCLASADTLQQRAPGFSVPGTQGILPKASFPCSGTACKGGRLRGAALGPQNRSEQDLGQQLQVVLLFDIPLSSSVSDSCPGAWRTLLRQAHPWLEVCLVLQPLKSWTALILLVQDPSSHQLPYSLSHNAHLARPPPKTISKPS